MAQLLIPRELRNLDRSTSKLTDLAKRVAIPADIRGTDWGPVANTCREEMGIEFDGWQDGMGQLMLARATDEPLDEGGMLAHTVGGFNLSAMRQIGKTYWGAGALFGLCQHYPDLLCLWTAHHSKALDCATELLTSNRGWITIGEARIGDKVIHPSGRATRIVGISPVIVNSECFEVTTTDGRSVVADGDHLWTVTDKWNKDSDSSGSVRKRTLRPPVTMTTRQLYDAGLGGSGAVSTRGKAYQTRKYRFMLPGQGRIIDLPERELPIDPYLLGAWLGDGTSEGSTLTCAAEDLIHWSKAVGEAGYLAVARKPANRAWTISIRTEGNAGLLERSLRGKLNRLGVLGNKHVPEDYLIGSVDQRIALLQGLMDTDGSINREGTAYFTSTTRTLAESVLFLSRSLGWRSTMKEGKASLKGKETGPVWRVTFTPKASDGLTPFRLKRKADRIDPASNRDGAEISSRNSGRFSVSIKSIEPVASRPVRCIKVSEDDGLFLAGRDLIVTHNTSDETFESMQGFAERRRIKPFIENIYTGSGNESIHFYNGSRIMFGARERGFGRGIPGVDVLFNDEGQIMSEKAQQAMLATMNTSWLGLHIYAGTPPSSEDLTKAQRWMTKHDEAWENEDIETIVVYTDDFVWVEFGGDDGCDPDDVSQWVRNPSVPHRTPYHAVQRLRRGLSKDGFMREGLGVYDQTGGSIFNMDRWGKLTAEDAAEPERAAVVVDVSPNRGWSAIGIAGELIGVADSVDELERTLVMVKSMPGTAGVADAVYELYQKRDLIVVKITPNAARSLETRLTKLGVEYEIMPQSEVNASYGDLQEAIKDGSVAHLDQPELNMAMVNTKTRMLQTGETESFDRREQNKDPAKEDVDTSPAVAVACALYLWGINNEAMPFIG